MILLLAITIPLCVELAAWAVDSSFEKYLLNWRVPAHREALAESRSVPS
jgi:hypothetical protein